jgi:peptidoglycan/xylan/chitin deacetylase (PgdA/CDA1 family)
MIHESVKEANEEFRENWREESSDRDLPSDIVAYEPDILLQIVYSADASVTDRWQTEGARRALIRFCDSDVGTSQLQIDVSNGDLGFVDEYDSPISIADLVQATQSTYELEQASSGDDGDFPNKVYVDPAPPKAGVYDRLDNSEKSMKEPQRIHEVLDEIGVGGGDDHMSPVLREFAIAETLFVVLEEIDESVLTTREFIAHHLANIHTYDTIATMLSYAFDGELSRGAANSHKQRADDKIQSAIVTVESTSNHQSAVVDMQSLSAREQSLLGDQQKNEIARTIRKEIVAGEGSSGKEYLSWSLPDGSSLGVDFHSDTISVNTRLPISEDRVVYIGGDIIDGPDDQTDLTPTIKSHTENHGNPTEYSRLDTTYRLTEIDVMEAFAHGFGEKCIGSWRPLSATAANWDADEDQWDVSFMRFIQRPDYRDDPSETVQHGYRYRFPGGGRFDADKRFRVAKISKWDSWIQFDDGRYGFLPTDVLEEAEYVGGTEAPLLENPCRKDEHDFGDVVLGHDEAMTTPCNYCRYTAATIKDMPGQIFPEDSLDFECDICGALTDSGDGHWRYEHERDSKICDDCWNSEYYPHIDMVADEFDHHILTCSTFLTSVDGGIYPEDVEFDASCQWIGRLCEETITYYLQEDSEEGLPSDPRSKPDVECPSCGNSPLHLRVIDLTESVASQAILETLAPEAVDQPHAAPIFGNDPESISRILSDSTHEELLETYHQLEREN